MKPIKPILFSKKNSFADSNKSSFERLRDELFDYRVEIVSFQRSIRTLTFATSLILAILAFFGYNRIENLVSEIENKTNQRLTVTDSLLSKINQKSIDSLNELILLKTNEYTLIVENFEKAISRNKELESILFRNMSINQTGKCGNFPYTIKNKKDEFSVELKNSTFKKDNSYDILVRISPEYNISEGDYLSVNLFPVGTNIRTFQKCFVVNSGINKLYFEFDTYQEYKHYSLEVVLNKRSGKLHDSEALYIKNIFTVDLHLK